MFSLSKIFASYVCRLIRTRYTDNNVIYVGLPIAHWIDVEVVRLARDMEVTDNVMLMRLLITLFRNF